MKVQYCYCLGDRSDDTEHSCADQHSLCILAYHPSKKKVCSHLKNDLCSETHKLRPTKSIICALNKIANRTFMFQTQCEAMVHYTKNTDLTYFTEILGENKTCDLQPLDLNISNDIFENLNSVPII